MKIRPILGYPHRSVMSDRHLPVRPNLVQLKHQAKDLLRDMKPERPAAKLADAQFELARSYGLASWPRLVLARRTADATRPADERTVRDRETKQPPPAHEIAAVAMALETYSRYPDGKHRCFELFAMHGVQLPDTPPMAVHRGRIDLLEDHLRRDPGLLTRTFSHEEIYPPELGCHADETLA